MGQYFMPVNYDRKQFLNPHKFGDGLKATEFIGGRGTMSALGFLLASPLSESRDFSMPNDIQMPDHCDPTLANLNPNSRILAGSWAGDRIEILGDYHDENRPKDHFYSAISQELEGWKDISELMWNIVEANSWGEWKRPEKDKRFWKQSCC